ncbi:NAD-dependent protein deacetylase [Corynebacterium phocae]|uniref:protein acetyllysine N-acetyltransferase n=1 Tax=Corynebacterium phocae TaxID=161895 RepID=A0A1L7D0K8_9CORY|nr:Sir2 family NAD-dependent protein deacetylase [Corynebacterium phocae]APT91620.1 NAD-dependent protein deacetylase [Corynebacterium phocae]KAA8720697.1 NAD-dependent protein deacetylase [Corynebacterium phocae]
MDPAVKLAHESALRSIARVVEETTPPTADAPTKVTRLIAQGGVMVLTGAGVSTDSGVPDYRGPRGSLSRHRPMTYQEFSHDPAASHRYWARSFVGWRVMNRAQPNRTHYALVELERAGLVGGIVTQNVDGLHAQAGTGNLVTLHGNLDHVACLDCGALESRPNLDARLEGLNPRFLERWAVADDQVNPDGDVDLTPAAVAQFVMAGCLNCGSKKLKPDVVYFGEPVPPARRDAAFEMLDGSKSLLVAGSSLAVMSGYRFMLHALKTGKEVAVINGGPGRGDAKATYLWRTAVGPAFDYVLDELGL